YLKSQLQGLTVEQAIEVESAVDFTHQLFAEEATADARKWRARLQALTSAIYKSRSSLSETLTVLEQAVQAKPGPMGNLWSQRLFEQNEQNEEEASASMCTHQALRLIQNTIRAQVEGGGAYLAA
ncbi:hypothetical protein PHYSODRAFT_477069, partial [Phytophthora sojae]